MSSCSSEPSCAAVIYSFFMGRGKPKSGSAGRGGHKLAENSSGFGALKLQESPVYYPTEEEFRDPLRFIEKIRAQAEAYGICRIVPPKSWKPPFARDLHSFSFPTKLQAIHQLQERPATCDADTFELEYGRFLEKEGGQKPGNRPVFQGQELDLCKLFNAVKRHGGFDKVVEEKKWGEVLRIINPSAVNSVHFTSVLCQLYHKYLYDYEIYQMCVSSGKRVRKWKRGTKRAAGESISASQGNPKAKRMRKSTQQSVVCSAEVASPLKDAGGGIKRPKEEDSNPEQRLDQICEQCQSGLHEELMLLCDRCDRGWHLYCLSPPLKAIPAGNWYCLDCLNCEKDSFGFSPGQHYSLDAFRRLADRFKRKWFGTTPTSHAEMERRFWEIVEGSAGVVEVMYGSDLDTSLYGSGFPRSHDTVPAAADPKVWQEHAASPWNLNNFPKLEGSMLRLVHDNIAGVMIPWLYIGMLFSSFCWHFEDHCFYSINYLHWGEPKCWYSVPGSAADAFEQVMRKTFPDLFEAQPDLLFQLVTMLNPTVLQGNGIPVCTTLQEPGNFVITFPRSFHGGFNCGLNCAEAVNFAPADWLPHGGFGVELYRLYHKPAVLSHEELLYVVAKSGFCTKALPFLKEELVRVINNERIHREQLWKNGIVRVSRMTSRKNPEYVGTEEDPECIICRYYLHLSAVVCNCRPGASVCLQHAERLCECNPDQQCLLYRYTLAELDDLLLMGDQPTADQDDEEKDSRVRTRRISTKQSSNTLQTRSLVKKVKGRYVTHTELAEAWLTNARNMLRAPFSQTDINDLLKQAEQFLWAGHEMDPVRSMEKNLLEAQKWAQDVTECLNKSESWIQDKCKTSLKVHLNHARDLTKVNQVPCIEPGFPKLKAMVEEADLLECEIVTALSSSSPVKITELEDLCLRAVESPFDLAEAGRLQSVIGSAKVWLERVEECLSGKNHSALSRCRDWTINMLYDLKSEASNIPILLPEMDLLEKLIQRVEMWQGRARELLKSPFKLQELELVLQDAEEFPVSIPELHILRQYKCSAVSWIDCCHDVLGNIHEQKDYSKAVEDLTSILTAGRTLKVQVEELDIVESELRKYLWREKASKALGRRLPLKIFEELINEVSMLQLPNEKLVDEVSVTVEAAHSWEQGAKNVLHAGACISEFEDLVRKSAEICATLPSLSIIKTAISTAESWLANAKPFLDQILRVRDTSNGPPLRVDVLQELIDQSKLLKISLKEPDLLRAALKNVEAWRSKVAMLQAHADLLLKSKYAWDAVCDNNWDRNKLMVKLEELIAGLQCAVTSGLTLGFEFDELAKLKNVSAALTWNLKALSFSSKTPSIQDVESLISDARNLPIMPREYKLLESALLESKRWLMKAFKILPCSSSHKKCSIQDLEELVAESQKLKISFPIKVGQIEEAISNHRAWQKQVHSFFSCKSSGLTWPELVQLKEVGQSSIVEESELEMLTSRIADIGSWILHCKAVVGHSASSSVPLQGLLVQIKDSLGRALRKFQMSNMYTDVNDFCICNGRSSEEIENIMHCTECKDRYHCSCLGLTQAQGRASRQYMCPFCTAVTSGTVCYEETYSRVSKRNRPTLDGVIELLNEANGLYPWVKEIELVEHIVECAKEWQSHLRATISHSLVHQDKNSGIDSGRLVIALKAIEVVEIEDQESSKLEAAVSINCWRNRAKALLDGPTKPHFRHIRRVLKEGLSMHVASKDYFLQELRRLERTASQWATRAKQVVADHGALELDEVYRFIEEGERLFVDFSKELEALKVRSVLYCICRKPYDEDRAMIACDRCSEWYHFDCINLPEPDSSDEGCELLLQQECGPTGEFICPVCKPPQMLECSNLTPKIDDYDSEFTSEEVSREGDEVTPPFDFVRGKRRSRPTGKARSNLQERLKGNFSSSHLERSKMRSKDKNQPENHLTASGRPCRRTAGQHSKFESFVLLMHSR